MKANEAPKTYPIQFKDKIDEYLWKEHHILGGCCSSIEEMKYSVAREVAEKLTKAFIEKAVNYLNCNLSGIVAIKDGNITQGLLRTKSEFIEDFRKYMEGE
jgi:hypothetical protein